MNRPTEPNDLPRFAELSAEYEILRELGRGGTAVVYLARDRELEREVAIKVIRTTYVEDEEAAARLVREARTLGRLQHPNIVALFGTRRLRDHSLALIMEYVPGHTLKSEVVQRGPLPHAQVTRVLADIARGLVFAHRQHIVHRDIKPENIYIDRDTGIARLSDFGIARIWDTDSSLTLPGTAIGTPTYMSPEQIEGGELDGRSDLFSLSLVGYEMLTGHRPWAGESLYSIVYKQKHEHLPSLALLRPDVPQALLVAIERALRKEPKDRWPDAEAFLRALGQPVPHHPPHPAPRVTVQPLTAEEDPDGATISYPRPAAAKVTEVTPDPLPMVPVPAVAHPEAVREDDDAPVVHTTPRRLVLKRPSPLVAAAVALLLLGAIAAIAIRPWGEPARAEPFVPVPKESPVVAAATPPASKPEPAVLAPVVASGAEQKGVAGDTLPEPLVLRVTDAAGQPARNAAVRFVVLSGSSTVVPVEGRTDTAGVIRARWLPRAPGTHEVEARLEQGGAAATFRARVAPKPAARLLATSAAQQRGKAGSALPPLVVRAEDDAGAPAPGVAVRFEVRSGGGRVTPKEVVTGSDGTARAQWVLGEGEEQEVVALLPGADAPSISFLASGTPPPLPVRRTIAAGGTHSCSLNGDGTAMCWGGNETGQLGDGSTGRRGAVRVAAPEPLATLSAGISHTCGIGVSGAAYCWGTNVSGQLGDGSQSARAQPIRVSTGTRLTKVVAGMSHSCALDAGGNLFCWGQNANGQLGDGTRTGRSAPVRAGGNRTFRSVTVGWAHTCALTTGGTAMCWGRNSLGELGDGTTADRSQPSAVAGEASFTELAAGSSHTCGLRSDGAVLCWGQNANGQLGTGDTQRRTSPTAVISDERFSDVTAGGVHTCALTREGTALCWGRNTYGQLGDGTTEDRTRPTLVAGERRFTVIAASGAHTCATAAGGGDFCWGLNLDGQLGDGTRSNQTRPVLVGRR